MFRTCFFSLVAFLGLDAAAVAPADTTATAVDDATSGRRESIEPAEPPTAAAGDRAEARVNCLQNEAQ